MKQKIVIKVCMPCDRCRTKALEVVARADGLVSVAIAGDERLEVVGEGIDIACLVTRLRKKICYAEILLVEEVKDKKPEEEEKKKPEEAKPPPVTVHPQPPSCPGYCSCHPLPPRMMVCEDPDTCAIM